jgi:hypothetical protein
MASYPHEKVTRLLRREGYSDGFISEVLRQLPEPVDVQRDQEILGHFGLSPEQLMDRMGAGP